MDPLQALRDAWAPFGEQRGQAPRGKGSLHIFQDEVEVPKVHGRPSGAWTATGWHLRNNRWELCAPGTPKSLRSLTSSALAEFENAQRHDSFCRCEACFGSLDVAPNLEPSTKLRSRALLVGTRAPHQSLRRRQRDKHLSLSTISEGESSWTTGLGPTERYVRMQTLPTEHALADCPARVFRTALSRAPFKEEKKRASSTALAIPPDLLTNKVSLEDLPHLDFESWEEKWNRELKFLNIQRQREVSSFSFSAGSKAFSTIPNGTSSTIAPSCAASSAPSTPAASRPSSRALSMSQERPISRSSGLSVGFRGAWAAYNSACAKLEADLRRRATPLRVSDVPWPPTGSVCGFVPEDGPKERKQKLRKALLRWHPDKWHGALEKSPEKAELAERLQGITQQILSERALA